MRFFIFQYLSGIGAFTSCGILNGKILRKEKRSFSQAGFQSNIHIPVWIYAPE